ncbi:putative leucine-rich repeat-containing protein DDB_G0290503 [Procambarus clarkii]|uniref:putative leucine-rich repeat-containing protein DDB_G0290503 n=1 Tax=Procambarus clarkii TaxID=6728 RepID=UPI003743F522
MSDGNELVSDQNQQVESSTTLIQPIVDELALAEVDIVPSKPMSDGNELASDQNQQQVESTIVDELTLTEVDVVPSPPMSGDSNPQPLFGRISDQVAALPKSEGKIRHRVIECKICMENENLNTSVRDLELTIVQLTKKLGDQENEIENLKKENLTLQDNQNKLKNNLEDRNNTELMKLRIQYDDEKKKYETEYAFLVNEKDRQIQHISEDKDKQIKDLADEKEKLTDLINSNNTRIRSKYVALEKELKSAHEQLTISRQQQEELNRKLAACENDIRIQKMQFLECQQALQKCNYDKQSDQEEYNKLLVSQKHYLEECEQKLLDCENSKQI